MELQNVIDNLFINNSKFTVKRKGKEVADGVKIYNYTLEYCTTKGLEIHYELQKEKDQDNFIIRLDCHIFPYWSIRAKNNKKYEENVNSFYSKEQADYILDVRKKFLKKLENCYKDLEKYKITFREDSSIRYLWVAEREIKDVSMEEEILANVYDFIAKTYPDLIRVLKDLEIIEK